MYMRTEHTEQISFAPGQKRHDRESQLAIRLVTQPAEFAGLRAQWEMLAKESFGTVFQSHIWLSRWWKYFGDSPSCALHILLFYSADTLVGIAPIFIELTTLATTVIHRRLKLMGSATEHRSSCSLPEGYGPSDYLDLIVSPEWEMPVAEAFVRYLETHTLLFDTLEFTDVPQDSFVVKRLYPVLRKSSFACAIRQSEVCPRLSVPSTMKEYIAGRDSGVRHRIHQALSTVAQGTMYTIKHVSTEEEFEEFFQALIDLHQRRWNRIGYPGLFANSWFARFQREVAIEMMRVGGLWCTWAIADDVPVAARLAFRFNDSYYDYLSGFDDAAPAARRRPGLALLLRMIENALQEKMNVVDFLRGDEKYKFELTEEYVTNSSLFVESGRQRPFTHRAIFLTARTFRRIRRRVTAEATLFFIQKDQHGILRSVPHYLSFRWSRFTEKPVGKYIMRAVTALAASIVKLGVTTDRVMYAHKAEQG